MFHKGKISVKGETGSMKGETISANFWQGKVQIYRQFKRDNGDATSVSLLPSHYFRLTTSVSLLPSHYFRLSLSLSLSLSLFSPSPIVPHAQYRKRFRASYNIDFLHENESSVNTEFAFMLCLRPCTRQTAQHSGETRNRLKGEHSFR